MTRNPLFSTYRQGENRVTSSILAVFQRIDLGIVERLLATATGESSLSMVQFVNQVASAEGTVPDGEVSARFRFLFEVKTERNALRKGQIDAETGHLSKLSDPDGQERLFILTPDQQEPSVIATIGDPRIAWFNFATLSQAIDDVLDDPRELVSEQGRFLLRELQGLFEEDGLLASRDVVVVAARSAYPEYLEKHAYICQPERGFADATRMGFYTKGFIQPEIPRIVRIWPSVMFTSDESARCKASDDPLERQAGELIERSIVDGTRADGQPYEIVLLTAPSDSETLVLDHPIRNTNVQKNGQPFAWTMYQRYIRSESLAMKPATTSELDEA